jgi:hypothetical protein
MPGTSHAQWDQQCQRCFWTIRRRAERIEAKDRNAFQRTNTFSLLFFGGQWPPK